MDHFRRIGDYFTEEQPTFVQNNQILAPLIAWPAITCRYYKGEILFGLLYNTMFVTYSCYKLIPKMSNDFYENT